MDYEQLFIDGYNLLHQPGCKGLLEDGLQSARQQLVRRIEQGAHRLASNAVIVFDGREKGHDAALDAPHLRVLYSPSSRTADELIEQMVHDASRPDRILVVTSDWTEQRVVSAFGASVISCRDFLERCEAAAPPPPRSKRGSGGATLGDFFPDQ